MPQHTMVQSGRRPQAPSWLKDSVTSGSFGVASAQPSPPQHTGLPSSCSKQVEKGPANSRRPAASEHALGSVPARSPAPPSLAPAALPPPPDCDVPPLPGDCAPAPPWPSPAAAIPPKPASAPIPPVPLAPPSLAPPQLSNREATIESESASRFMSVARSEPLSPSIDGSAKRKGNPGYLPSVQAALRCLALRGGSEARTFLLGFERDFVGLSAPARTCFRFW